MTETSQDTSSPSPPGTALVVINERLQELAKVPGIEEKRRTLGDKLGAGGALMGAGGFVGCMVLAFLCPTTAPALLLKWIFFVGMEAGVGVRLICNSSLTSEADKRHLALQDERKQLLLEQSNELRRQQQAAEQKQREEEAEKNRQRCERLMAAADARVRTIADEDLHAGYVTDLPDPDDASRILLIGITEVVTCNIGGQKTKRATARLYDLVPEAPGELLEAPTIEGTGPILHERPAPESSRFQQLRLLRRSGLVNPFTG